ncbi:MULTISPECIES: hypothetical protein [unclassified Methylobacterium]|uniref:hypothetical protein n=1 Tax=unclassified Methylobacterium TaxID=2615210 RepID=UPI0011C1D7C0|nr:MULTISPECIES: hypothetical protein [unclassified Methylobacterium]QEE38832.1 hypothetical protein FVA80_07500 [Methylobacterium sp. WL1]TXN53612.1 hypothetical protein FV241_27435 [Methylobacterium sp. WL2]
MAWKKYDQFVTKGQGALFDQLSPPGTVCKHSGVYRCEICGHEAVSTKGHALPPQNHHTHPSRQPIQWRLTVACAHA